MNARGGTVSRQACEELVREHESALKQGGRFARADRRANRFRRAGKRLLGAAGIGIGLIMVAGQAAAGERVTWTDVGESLPIVGPVVTTYVAVDEITQQMVQRANGIAEESQRAQNQAVEMTWRSAGYLANRVAASTEYPWSGEGWRSIDYVNLGALHECMETVVVTMQSRMLTCQGLSRQIIDRWVADGRRDYLDCIERTVVTRRPGPPPL
jgi:hypothetical protein